MGPPLEWECDSSDYNSCSSPRAQYVHCRRHLLNLCIVHSSQVRIVRNVMDTMQEVSASFKRSAKRFLAFQEQLAADKEV